MRKIPRKRRVITKPMQKQAIDNIMSGKYKSKKRAIMAAGYSESVGNNPHLLLSKKGALQYLENFETKARIKFGVPIESKLQDVYLEGLEADRPWGKNDIIPDYKVRKEYADTISEMLGLVKTKARDTKQQFNYFMLGKKDRDNFNTAFNDFIKEKSLED